MQINLSPYQAKAFKDRTRFKVFRTGRRGGKTYLALCEIIRAIIPNNSIVLYMLPTHQMIKRTMYPLLTKYIPNTAITKINLSDFTMQFVNGSILYLGSAGAVQSFLGMGINTIIMDEVQNQNENDWYTTLRPTLSDTKGNAIFAGTPRGHNNFLYKLCTSEEIHEHTWTTLQGGWVDPEEVEQAKSQLDERTFRQEYEADFETSGNIAYYSFSDNNIGDYEFITNADTYLAFDFNAGECPMSAAVLQVQPDGTTAVVKEFVNKYSNTDATCQLIQTYLVGNNFNGTLTVCGDHHGVRRESSASFTDYQIIEHYFKHYARYEVYHKPTRSVKDRVAATNSLFCTYDGTRRLFVDKRCVNTIEDFRYVEFKSNTVQLDGTNPERTHISDAISYFANNIHPIMNEWNVS